MIENPVGKQAVFDMLTSPSIEGEILYSPGGAGDSWIVEKHDGAQVYIQTFASMYLVTALEKADE